MTKTTISPERKAEIKQVVYDTLVHANLKYLPIDIKKICKSFDFIRVIPFSVHMRHRNITLEEVYKFCETEDACADYYADVGKYIIYYNDVIEWKYITCNRYRWSLAHELGHILLKHHITHDKTKIFRSELSGDVYDYLEEEADYFAQLILVPHVVLLGFRVNSAKSLKNVCKISKLASKKRYKQFVNWKSHINPDDEYDNKIHSFFYSFIYKKKCKNCGAAIVQRYGKYCPICGDKNNLEWGEGKMIYPKLKTNENEKLVMCPICKNEETNINGNFCQICGNLLVNICSNVNCYTQLPSNARFCPICGSKSTFFIKEQLVIWQLEYIDEFTIPKIIDESLSNNN